MTIAQVVLSGYSSSGGVQNGNATLPTFGYLSADTLLSVSVGRLQATVIEVNPPRSQRIELKRAAAATTASSPGGQNEHM